MPKPTHYTSAPVVDSSFGLRTPLSLDEKVNAAPFNAVIEEIERLRDFEDDWDSEGALAVDAACIASAKEFIAGLRSYPIDDCAHITMPDVNATVEGGVQLYWFTEWGQTALTFTPGESDVQMQRKQLNAPGEHGSVTIPEAMRVALQAICNH